MKKAEKGLGSTDLVQGHNDPSTVPPHSVHNYADADLNVRRPQQSAEDLSLKTAGSETCWAPLTVPPPLVGAAAPTASHSTYHMARMCKSRSNSGTLRLKIGKHERYLVTLLISVMSHTLQCFYRLVWRRGKYIIKPPLFVVSIRLFCTFICPRTGNKTPLKKHWISRPA